MPIMKQKSESLVMVRQRAESLRRKDIIRGSIKLRSKTIEMDEGNVNYLEDEDFIVDHKKGTIERTKNSRIPDWSNHVLFGKKNFNHTLYNDYSNKGYTIYADYDYKSIDDDNDCEIEGSGYRNAIKILEFLEKLKKRKKVNFVIFGDSISCGCEASRKEFMFFNRFATELQKRYKDTDISLINKSIPGESTLGAIKRIDRDVISLKPDLVCIGYGMNDQVKGGTKIDDFYNNVCIIVKRLKEKTDADIILATPCVSNPLWMYSSGNILEYTEVLRKIGREYKVSIADVYNLWVEELDAGKSHESLLLNNINHPNDYGHWIYYKAFLNVI